MGLGRARTVYVYLFPDLTPEAQERAIEQRREWIEVYTDEWTDSLKAFEEYTDVKVTDYDVRDASSYRIQHRLPDFDTEGWVEGLTGLRLRTWLVNNWSQLWTERKVYYGPFMPGRGQSRRSRFQDHVTEHALTGAHSDYPLVQPFLEFIRNPDGRTLGDLVGDALDDWARGVGQDIEDQYSDERIREDLTEMGAEFFEDGRLCDLPGEYEYARCTDADMWAEDGIQPIHTPVAGEED